MLNNVIDPSVEPDESWCLMYAGSPSTGKTDLANTIATLLGIANTPCFIKIEAASCTDTSQLLGSAPGLVGAESSTISTKLKTAVDYRQNVSGDKATILVFIDEIHKIKMDSVQSVIREFIDTGKLEHATSGQSVQLGKDFIVILTTNWGQPQIISYWNKENQALGEIHRKDLEDLVEEDMQVTSRIEGATIRRYGKIVPFIPLSRDDAVSVLRTFFQKTLSRKLDKIKHVDIGMDDAVFMNAYDRCFNPIKGVKSVYQHGINQEFLQTFLKDLTKFSQVNIRLSPSMLEVELVDLTTNQVIKSHLLPVRSTKKTV